MLVIFTMAYSVMKIKPVAVIYLLQRHPTEFRCITTHGKNRLRWILMLLQYFNILKFACNSEVRFKMLAAEYGMVAFEAHLQGHSKDFAYIKVCGENRLWPILFMLHYFKLIYIYVRCTLKYLV